LSKWIWSWISELLIRYIYDKMHIEDFKLLPISKHNELLIRDLKRQPGHIEKS